MDKSWEKKLIVSIGEKRYQHSKRVMEIGVKLAYKYNVDIEKTRTAAILHDCGKIPDKTKMLKMVDDFGIILDNCMQYNHELIHGPLGSEISKVEYGIDDIEILDAIYYHTTGRENMSILDKIIYIADYIEPKRDFKEVEEVRNMAFINLDKSIILAMGNIINFLIQNNKLIHPNTVKSRNYLLIQLNKE